MTLLLGLSLAWAHATAQSRNLEEYPVQAVAVTEIEGEVGAEFNYFGETIRRDGSGRTRFSNTYFQEYFLGRSRGYVYHPDFLHLDGELKLGLSQQNLSYSSPFEDSRSSSDLDTIIGYRIRGDILRRKPVSATVSASRDERILMGLFLDRHRVVTDSYSGTIRWRGDSFRMDLTARRTETEEFGFRSRGSTLRDEILYNLRHEFSPRSRTDLRYRLQRYERDFTARTLTGDVERETDLTTHDLSIINRTAFDNANRLSLRSTFRFHDREGTQDLRTYYIEERLRYDAARWMRPYLLASFRRNEFRQQDINTYRGEAGFDGDLYESLNYHFDLHGTRTDRDAFTEDRYGVTGRLNYRKLTPLGVLTAGYARTLDQVERRGIAQLVPVFDEPLFVRIAVTSFLRETNIIPGSIRVTDTAGLIVYQEGFDYEVIEQGNRVGLRVLPGGLLPDGSNVLVDYSFQSDESESYLADDESMYVRHDFTRPWEGLSLYARRNTFRAHNIDGPVRPSVTEHTTNAAGLRQEWGDFAYSTEYETYDDDFSGYDRWRNQVEGTHRIASRTRWGWRAGVIDTWHDREASRDRDRSDRHLFIGTHLHSTFGRGGYWRIEGRYLEDTGRTERTTWGGIARVGWQWRRLSLEGGARYEQLSFLQSDQERLQLFAGLRLSLGRRVFTEPRR